jgi:hypothetical protein
MAKNKLPKRIAGVKVPKEVRRAPVALWLYNSGFLRELIVSALLAASAALAEHPIVRRKAAGAKAKAGKAAASAARTVRRAALRKSTRAKQPKRRAGGRPSTSR